MKNFYLQVVVTDLFMLLSFSCVILPHKDFQQKSISNEDSEVRIGVICYIPRSELHKYPNLKCDHTEFLQTKALSILHILKAKPHANGLTSGLRYCCKFYKRKKTSTILAYLNGTIFPPCKKKDGKRKNVKISELKREKEALFDQRSIKRTWCNTEHNYAQMQDAQTNHDRKLHSVNYWNQLKKIFLAPLSHKFTSRAKQDGLIVDYYQYISNLPKMFKRMNKFQYWLHLPFHFRDISSKKVLKIEENEVYLKKKKSLLYAPFQTVASRFNNKIKSSKYGNIQNKIDDKYNKLKRDSTAIENGDMNIIQSKNDQNRSASSKLQTSNELNRKPPYMSLEYLKEILMIKPATSIHEVFKRSIGKQEKEANQTSLGETTVNSELLNSVIETSWILQGGLVKEKLSEKNNQNVLEINFDFQSENRSGIELHNENRFILQKGSDVNFEFSNVSDVDFSLQNGTDSNFTLVNVPGNLSVILDPFKRRNTKKVVYINGLFELSRSECRDHPETGYYEFKAAQLAIRQINKKNIINGYQLEMYHNDTLCDSGVAVDSFFHSLYRQPVMMAVLGTGSSEVTERLARVVSRWNILQMSYGATSPVLSDRDNFPMFFRTVAPDSSHNRALLEFVLYHKWYTVTTFHEQGDKHSLPMTKLATDLEQMNVTVALTKGTSERDYKEHLQDIKNQDSRIIIGSFSPSLFRKIFCEVFKFGMYGADYAWLVLGDNFLWNDISETECNDHQLARAMQGVISVGSHYEVVGNDTPLAETTMTEILSKIDFQLPARSSGYIAQTYDAVWAIALALREVEEHWKSTYSSLTLRDFTYDNQIMSNRFTSTMSKLYFMGISGPVSFHNSDRVGITAFHQIQGNDLKLVTIYSPSKLQFGCAACNDIIWQGGSPPISSRNIILKIAVLDRRVFLCVTALAVLGVTMALTFLTFNLYYRKRKFIKLSSPNLNNFVIVGCILVYVAVILLGMDHGTLFSDSHFHIICSARAFLLSCGFSLAFGCMFIKTYRVYHIFIRANTGVVKSKLLHDQQLLGMVSLLLLIDCILVVLWITIDPMERKLISLSMQVNKDERNVVYLNLREHCSSVHGVKWLGSLYIYKGLLLVVGCYMAWETRRVKVPALNDSQYIGMSVYNVVITSIIVVALANVIPAERYTLTFVLVSMLIFVSTTTTLCILFVPKIHTILINPEDAAVVATPGVKVECKTRRFAIDEPRESVYRAEVLNRALKRELKELDEEFDKRGILPFPVRNAINGEQNQVVESDDELPPWIEEYKCYSNGNDVWCTSRPTITSAFSAIHQVALQIPSNSADCQRETAAKVDIFLSNPGEGQTKLHFENALASSVWSWFQ